MIRRGLGAAVLVVAIDQFSKYLVLKGFGVATCMPRQGTSVTGFLDLVLTCNRGMSFGLFNSGQGLSVPLFSLAAAAIVGILIFWLSRVRSDILAVAVGMIIGGAVGNVIDRWWGDRSVIDFIYFHLGEWFKWPAFNLADSAICLGVVTMLFEGLLARRFGPSASEEEDQLP